jgi:WD40 repeat protein
MQLKGHKLSVEDAKFKPGEKDILCSVGVDRRVLFWDLRTGFSPVSEITDAHSSDINTVDWSCIDLNLVATGSNDTKV